MDAPGQVKVVFTTSDEEFQLPDTKRQLLVPADIRRYGLSRVLNSESMLGLETAVPFDFLVDGAFLRTTLAEYLTEHKLSAETTVTLRYVRSLIPPVFESSFQHDDWVSSVDVSKTGKRLLTGSYDGLLRLWNAFGEVTATSAGAADGGHLSYVRSARFVTPTQVASAGLDRTVRIWKITGDDESGSTAFKPTLELYGHRHCIVSLATDAVSKRVLSASADGHIGVWSTSKSSSPAAPENLIPGGASAANKRRKVAAPDIPRRGALSLVQVHKSPASAVIFDPQDRTVAYSAGQDHTLSTLDLTTAQIVSTLSTTHSLMSLCAVGGSNQKLLAAGNAARNVVLVDPRESVATTSVMTLRGHVNTVVALSASPENDYSMVSGSHDGTCRIWDLRSSRRAVGEELSANTAAPVSEPVFVIERESLGGKKRPLAGESVKVFDVTWDKTWGIVSGGEDKQVQINRGRNIVGSNDDNNKMEED